MFTGIIEEIGQIEETFPSETGVQLKISGKSLMKELKVKSSISVSGCCLTCTSIDGEYFTVDVVAETLRKTCLGGLKAGDFVNLELPMIMNARLDGHLVQGHVDYVGSIIAKKALADHSLEMTFSAPEEMVRYVVEKGSVAVDGISLTAWNVKDSTFSVALIPYTAKNTTLGFKNCGDKVNLEVDLIAKYVEKLRITK